MNIYLRKIKPLYGGKIENIYQVTRQLHTGIFIHYEFPRISEEEDEKRINNKETLSPEKVEFAKNKEGRRLVNYSTSDLVLLKGTLEDYCLKIPDAYEGTVPEVEEVVSQDIDAELLKKLKESARSIELPLAIIGEGFEDVRDSNPPETSTLKVFCPVCKKVAIRAANPRGQKETCPHCSKYLYRNDYILDNDLREYRKEAYSIRGKYSYMYLDYPLKKQQLFYYMVARNNGVSLYKISCTVSIKKGKYTISYNIDSSIEHRVGEETCAYRHLKKGKKEVDPFDVLNINSKTINTPPPIIYDGASSFIQFAKNNEKAMRMTGFMELLKYSPQIHSLEAMFITFLGVMNKYPVFEQIIKSGHTKLFYGLYDKMMSDGSKQGITETVNQVAELVDTSVTKGDKALRFPSYIGEYLIKKGADLTEYYYWRDIFEITDLSKEQFEDIINSFDYAYINGSIGFEDIGNILKYGYKPKKLLSYIIKCELESGYSVSYAVNTLKDYLFMCELSGVDPDLFPQDLAKQHDDMTKLIRKNGGSKEDLIIQRIADDCEAYIPQDLYDEDGNLKVGVPKLLKDYVIVFPSCTKDFVNEGNMQHNCVASYASRVSRGDCVIFFVRERSNPAKSYITAECRRNGLGQFYMSNNRYVVDSDMLSFGEYVAKKIIAGVNSGRIKAMKNL